MTGSVVVNLRRHGRPPYRIAVLHGGPGAAGEMAPVARRVSRLAGVLEPLQTAASVDGQIAELAACLRAAATLPVALVGHSWGAWLGVCCAARHPDIVRELILVASAPFTDQHAATILQTRLARLRPEEGREAQALLGRGAALDDAGLARLGSLFARADAYDPLPPEAAETKAAPLPRDDAQAAIFAAVWPEAAALRASGELLRRARSLRCPVLAIHGEHDPHPVAGVCEPLADLAHFRCVPLPRCGHTPWLERHAREPFFRLLATALGFGDACADA